MKKRILSFVLVLSLISNLIISFPITANAETIASGTCGDDLIWSLDDNGTLTISGTGNMMDYPLSDSPWRRYRIENIIIDEGVTSIGYCTFGECYSLTSITIPSSVTSISERAFPCYSKLTSINVDKDNENYCSVDGILFNKTKTKLIQYPSGKSDTKYTIPSSVTKIGGYAFCCCCGLTSITIPNRDCDTIGLNQ